MLFIKRRKQKKAGDPPQYELDFDLNPLEKHFMFWEYLEIGKSRTDFNDEGHYPNYQNVYSHSVAISH